MKTRYWVLIVAALLALCVGVSLWLAQPKAPADFAEIYVDGKLIKTVDLRTDQSFWVDCGNGRNEITVRGGELAVTEADCPDGYCVKRGWQCSGADIVCLPHRLIIKFTAGGIDAVAG